MKILVLTLLAVSLAAAASAEDRTGRLGAGLELGEQNGLTAKYWTGPNQAIAGGLGVSDGDLSVHGEYMWHSWSIFPQPEKGSLAAHLSAGGRVRDDEFGLRTTAGVDYWLAGNPVELFFDAGPIIRFTPGTGADFTVALGVRAYFAKR